MYSVLRTVDCTCYINNVENKKKNAEHVSIISYIINYATLTVCASLARFGKQQANT